MFTFSGAENFKKQGFSIFIMLNQSFQMYKEHLKITCLDITNIKITKSLKYRRQK